jgi:NAD(P)-dependent dehydrogenase (short-subunit alcohol dehydrogenase family)
MLVGRTVLVTGGLGRLGQPLTQWLEEQGARVLVTSRSRSKVETFNAHAADVQRSARAVYLPFDDEEAFRTTARQLVSEHSPIHGLVNNATPDVPYRPVGNVPWGHWRDVTTVTLAAAETLAATLAEKRAQSEVDSIVNVSSIYGLRAPYFPMYGEGGEPSAVYYGAVKAGMIGLTRYLAALWGPEGIRVNAVSPAGIRTQQSQAFLASYATTVPTGEMVQPEEVAAAIGFLLSPHSRGTTGANLVVDGGKTIWS